MTRRVSTTKTANWTREAADAINQTIAKLETDEATLATAVLKDGVTIYAGDTAGVGYSQTKTQAMMDAIKAISDRLKA